MHLTKFQLILMNPCIIIGAVSKEEVEKIFDIHIGAPVVPDVTFEYNEVTGVMLGKAFDNRLGCAAVLEAMNALKEESLETDIVGVLSTQEGDHPPWGRKRRVPSGLTA